MPQSDSILPSAIPAQFVAGQPPELSVIVPTFNESENVEPMIRALGDALVGIPFEVVFVDDNSPDGTAALVKRISRLQPGIRCLHRIGRRGLSSAVVEGVLSSSAPFVAVVDGDMQHDETKLPAMLALLREDSADVVVGSRHVDGGGLGDWTASRVWMSSFATRLSRTILKGQALQDPMSGFFMTRREVFDRVVPQLSIEGFKILLDFIASSETRMRIAEVPYHFRQRVHGESKLDSLVLWEYGVLLIDKLVGKYIPPRFVLFVAVGATGVAVHFAVLSSLISFANQSFLYAQGAATLVAMTWNFILNDTLTYRDKRLTGLRWFGGLLSFYAVCGLGALANVGIASALFEKSYSWWVAASAGIVVGTVFNYAMTSIFTWKGRRS